MIGVDTNILVYAHRRDAPEYPAAFKVMKDLAEGDRPWGVPWPCVHEFLAVVSNPRAYKVPTTVALACEQVEVWAASKSCSMLGETSSHLMRLRSLLEASRALGGNVHDARVAAICLEHDVSEIWSADRDFRRFPGLRVVNPLTG